MAWLSWNVPGWLSAGTARLDGLLHPDFMAVAAALRRQLETYPGGAAVCVYHRGTCVVDLWGGARDGAGTPWTADTMSPSFSTTKGVAATALHVAVDRGLLDYDDRVAEHWPEFAQAGKGGITIRHVLAHQSGLYHIRQMIDHAARMLDWEYMVRAIERTRPIHEPGTRTGYHGLTFGFLVGEILRRVTGRSFAEFVREAIAEPLGTDGMYVGAPAEQLHRAARLLWPEPGWLPPNAWWLPALVARRKYEPFRTMTRVTQQALRLGQVHLDFESILDSLAPRGIGSFDFGAAETLQATIPAANGLFTARSLARMYAALADGGSLDGVQLLSPRTLARATEVQTRARSQVVIPFEMQWRLGYHGVLTTRGVPRRAFGHFGFGGSGAWAEPRRRLAVALIVNSGMGTPFGDLRIARIGGAALGCVAQDRLPLAVSLPATLSATGRASSAAPRGTVRVRAGRAGLARGV